jgi:hypothetical protein
LLHRTTLPPLHPLRRARTPTPVASHRIAMNFAASATSLAGPNEVKASMDPSAYAYATPTPQQQQQMYQQYVQMAFFAFSQMQMQSAMGYSAFPLPGFPAPAFCGMPPMPPGEAGACPNLPASRLAPACPLAPGPWPLPRRSSRRDCSFRGVWRTEIALWCPQASSRRSRPPPWRPRRLQSPPQQRRSAPPRAPSVIRAPGRRSARARARGPRCRPHCTLPVADARAVRLILRAALHDPRMLPVRAAPAP